NPNTPYKTDIYRVFISYLSYLPKIMSSKSVNDLEKGENNFYNN
ncbi:MAG: hypothetical protein ACI9DJ_000997, partial [Algoriphagus sp.]